MNKTAQKPAINGAESATFGKEQKQFNKWQESFSCVQYLNISFCTHNFILTTIKVTVQVDEYILTRRTVHTRKPLNLYTSVLLQSTDGTQLQFNITLTLPVYMYSCRGTSDSLVGFIKLLSASLHHCARMP